MSITAFVEAVAQELRLRGVSFHEQDLLLFLVRYVGTIPGARSATRWADEFIKAAANSARRASLAGDQPAVSSDGYSTGRISARTEFLRSGVIDSPET